MGSFQPEMGSCQNGTEKQPFRNVLSKSQMRGGEKARKDDMGRVADGEESLNYHFYHET